MTFKTFQIFRAGTFTGMSGRPMTFTPGDVANMAKCYSESVSAAPLVLGHPANDGPSMGTVKKLVEKAGNLYAVADVSQPLIDLVRAGAYGTVSAAFHSKPVDGKWYLRHVGFLGAMAPAVKGMADLNFAEHGGACFAEPCAVSFAEIEHGGVSYRVEVDRMALHHAAKAMVSRNPGMSYIAAVRAIDGLESTAAGVTRANAMRHERAAFHEAAVCFQEAIPGASYEDAVIKIQAAGMRL